VENTPLYPFGYGLSYTTFNYNAIKVSKKTYQLKENVKVSCVLKNTGKLKGKEVAQLYIRDLTASVTRPVRELKGFKSVTLDPGASQTITFTLTENELGFYNNEGNYVVEPGMFEVFIGGSSQATLKSTFELVSK
jgi:beta-glucosidase